MTTAPPAPTRTSPTTVPPATSTSSLASSSSTASVDTPDDDRAAADRVGRQQVLPDVVAEGEADRSGPGDLVLDVPDGVGIQGAVLPVAQHDAVERLPGHRVGGDGSRGREPEDEDVVATGGARPDLAQRDAVVAVAVVVEVRVAAPVADPHDGVVEVLGELRVEVAARLEDRQGARGEHDDREQGQDPGEELGPEGPVRGPTRAGRAAHRGGVGHPVTRPA